MTTLVIAEHDNASIKSATRNTITAAAELGAEITLLVVGTDCQAAANEAASIAGVAKVLVADSAVYAHQLPEAVAPLIAQVASNFTHILAPATTTGKNLMPRVAALLDVAQISDIVTIKSTDTFVRPIYAGSALATVQSGDAIKVITVRTTAYAEAAAEGGSASVDAVDTVIEQSVASFVSEELSVSERPSLSAASIIISGVVACRVVTISFYSKKSQTSWARASAHHAQPLTRDLCLTITRLDKPVKSSLLTSTLPWVSRARFNILPV